MQATIVNHPIPVNPDRTYRMSSTTNPYSDIAAHPVAMAQKMMPSLRTATLLVMGLISTHPRRDNR